MKRAVARSAEDDMFSRSCCCKVLPERGVLHVLMTNVMNFAWLVGRATMFALLCLEPIHDIRASGRKMRSCLVINGRIWGRQSVNVLEFKDRT